MSNESRDKHEKMIEQVAATMAIEDMPLSQACYENLRAMAPAKRHVNRLQKKSLKNIKSVVDFYQPFVIKPPESAADYG